MVKPIDTVREKLSNVFDIAPPMEIMPVSEPKSEKEPEDESLDPAFIRKCLVDLVKQGKDLSKAATDNAICSDNPEMLSAAAKAQKELREHIMALADLAKKPESKDAAAAPDAAQTAGTTTINSKMVAFVGTTADLAKIMRGETPREAKDSPKLGRLKSGE